MWLSQWAECVESSKQKAESRKQKAVFPDFSGKSRARTLPTCDTNCALAYARASASRVFCCPSGALILIDELILGWRASHLPQAILCEAFSLKNIEPSLTVDGGFDRRCATRSSTVLPGRP